MNYLKCVMMGDQLRSRV